VELPAFERLRASFLSDEEKAIEAELTARRLNG